MLLIPGQILAGRYEVLQQIGSGGMSIVYKATDRKLGRFVTVKVLREEYISNRDFKNKFQVEATAVASLNHPNITNVYDIGQENNVNYIVMEFIDGVTLKELIEKRGPFSNQETMGVALQIAKALSHAHSMGIIHRDIKPQNVLVMPKGIVKVMDFGIAHSKYARNQHGAGPESTMGSVHYISPEHAKNSGIDERSDLYSLGILMFEMAAGGLPFDGENVEDILYMHVNEELPDVSDLNHNISADLRDIIVKLTQKKPLRRYQNADELVNDLNSAITTPDETPARDRRFSFATFSHGEEPDEEDPEELMDYGVREGHGSIRPGGRGKKKEFIVMAGAVLCALLLAVAVFAFVFPMFMNNNDSELASVPKLVGLTLDEATAKAGDAGLLVSVFEERYDGDYDAGLIIIQDYDEGANVKEGTTVQVVVSVGSDQIEMPDLRGIALTEAYTKAASGLFSIVESAYEYSGDVALGSVISQTPAGGTMAAPGSSVELVISKGPETQKITVPNVLGMTQAAAETALESAGLVVGHISSGNSSRYSEGVVMAQTTEGGREVYEGTTVGLVISTGQPEATIAADPSPTATASAEPSESGGASASPISSATPSGSATIDPTGSESESPTGEEPSDPDESATPTTSTYLLTLDPYIEEGAESVTLTLYQKTNSGLVEVYNASLSADDFPIGVTVSGSGTVEYALYINGVNVGTKVVNFGG